MRNVKAEIKGDKLLIEVDLSKDGEKSSSQKNMVVGSSEGNQSVGTHKGRDIKLGLNVYYKYKA